MPKIEILLLSVSQWRTFHLFIKSCLIVGRPQSVHYLDFFFLKNERLQTGDFSYHFLITASKKKRTRRFKYHLKFFFCHSINYWYERLIHNYLWSVAAISRIIIFEINDGRSRLFSEITHPPPPAWTTFEEIIFTIICIGKSDFWIREKLIFEPKEKKIK